jgi:hypothetical protein
MSLLPEPFVRRVLAGVSAAALVASGVVAVAAPASASGACDTTTPEIGQSVTCEVGVDSVTIPDGATSVYIDAYGGGGGGGKPNNPTDASGGHGANVWGTLADLTGLTAIDVTVGAGGAGGDSTVTGGRGGGWSGAASNGTDLIIAGGGGGASASASTSGGDAGAEVTTAGSDGGAKSFSTTTAGGGKGGSGVTPGIGGLGGIATAPNPVVKANGIAGQDYVANGGGVDGAAPTNDLGGAGNGVGGGGGGYGGGGGGGKAQNGPSGAGGGGGSFYASSIDDPQFGRDRAGGASLNTGGDPGLDGAVTLKFYGPAATVSAISPATGDVAGGNTVTITGTNFFYADNMYVYIGDEDCTDIVVNSATELTCTVPTSTVGAGAVDVEVENGTDGETLTGGYVYTAGTAPTFTAESPATSATAGTAYSYTFAATGDPAPSFAVTSGALPVGLTLNPTTGVFSGTPTTPGTYTFKVTATNGVSPDDVTANITITVEAASMTCPLQIIQPRPAGKKLPVGKKVVLVKRMKTVPECGLELTASVKGLTGRGDLRPPMKFKINKKTGKVTVIARRADAKARVPAVAIPLKAPYTKASKGWKRTWSS